MSGKGRGRGRGKPAATQNSVQVIKGQAPSASALGSIGYGTNGYGSNGPGVNLPVTNNGQPSNPWNKNVPSQAVNQSLRNVPPGLNLPPVLNPNATPFQIPNGTQPQTVSAAIENISAQFSDALTPASNPVTPSIQNAPITKAIAKVNNGISIDVNRAKRPGYGKLGYKKIDLLVNYFQLNVPHGVVHQYDIDIVRINVDAKFKAPSRYETRITRKIFDKIISDHKIFQSHLPVYDGNKIVITRRSLGLSKPQEVTVTIENEGEELTFVVTIKPSNMRNGGSDGEIDLEDFHRFIHKKQGDLPKEAIKAIDLVFKHGPSLVYTPIGKSFFRKPSMDEVPPHGEGREIWFGHNQSVRPSEWTPVINIDLTATTFYQEGPCIEFLKNVTGLRNIDRSLNDRDLDVFNREIKNIKVKVTHNIAYERKFRVVGAIKRNAREMTFPLKQEDGRELDVSIEFYFKQRYGVHLRYPLLPLLQMQPKEKNVFVPIECCKIMPDQHCRKKLSDTLTAQMIRETLRTPKQRFKEIKQYVEDAKEKALPYLNEFNIEMSTEPMGVSARVLNPPKIVYSIGKDEFLPKQGQWNMQDHQFFHGVQIDSWAIINFGNCGKNNRVNLEKMLYDIGHECGIKFGKCEYNEDLREADMSVLNILERMKTKFPNISLVIVILNSKKNIRGTVQYEEVKQACDTQLGLVTQCVKDINVEKKCSKQLISNVCQKINAKMGGTNNTISAGVPNEKPKLMDSPVIIMGADVTHPAPEKADPSIAAVVGSLDRHLTKYAARIKVQKNLAGYQSRIEIIQELKHMVKDLLLCFYKKLGKKPGKIIFYRDGVSEGQFSEVCSYEINQIKQACQELQEDYKPFLTFIVVQKRHSTRFCPKNDRDGCGRPGNIPPGTTVDTGIVSPVDFDFYLCSHYGLQGTSKPTHYTVLWDESQLSADDVQMLSYYLCHTYSRCTRSISLPAPVQYAHLAAFRARAHIKKVLDDNGFPISKQHKYGSMVAVDDIADAVAIEKKLADSMYFV